MCVLDVFIEVHSHTHSYRCFNSRVLIWTSRPGCAFNSQVVASSWGGEMRRKEKKNANESLFFSLIESQLGVNVRKSELMACTVNNGL